MRLKSFFIGAASLLLAATFASCSSNNDNEYHTFYFFRETPTRFISSINAYADQTVDSARVCVTDTWTLNKSYDDSWLDVKYQGQTPPLTVNVAAGNYITQYSDRINLQMQPNTTGKTRYTTLSVTSSYGKLGTTPLYILQYPHLNISSPALTKGADGTVDSGKFVMANINADGYVSGTKDTKPYITFTVYSSDATLTSSADWLIVPEKTTLPGIPAYVPNELQKVELTVEKNDTKEARTATLTLTSKGVSSTIEVTQLNK